MTRPSPREAAAGARPTHLRPRSALIGLIVTLAAVSLVAFARRGSLVHRGPLLATTASQASGVEVDGIPCESTERLAYHFHAHLAVYVNGAARTIPAGIGIPGAHVEHSSEGPVATGGSCVYWLHSHTEDGIVHVESPVDRPYTLGQYFDLWGQPLDGDRVGPAEGKVTTYVSGTPWAGSPRDVPLAPHAVIQLDVGKPVGPRNYHFPNGY